MILTPGDVGRLEERPSIEAGDFLIAQDASTKEIFRSPQAGQANAFIEKGALTLSCYNRRLTGNWRDFGIVELDTSKISFEVISFVYLKTGLFSSTVEVRIQDADSGLVYFTGNESTSTRGFRQIDLTATATPVPSTSRLSVSCAARRTSGFSVRALNLTGIYKEAS